MKILKLFQKSKLEVHYEWQCKEWDWFGTPKLIFRQIAENCPYIIDKIESEVIFVYWNSLWPAMAYEPNEMSLILEAFFGVNSSFERPK